MVLALDHAHHPPHSRTALQKVAPVKPVLALFDFDGTITHNWVDRPFMVTVWSVLATTEARQKAGSVVGQALLWPTLGIISAMLWTALFPHL